MFTQWQQVESWIRDNGLNSWRFMYDKTGTSVNENGDEKQTRSNRVAILSDALPGDLDEKIALTKRRLMAESNQTLYGYGKRGKENTGQMYCEVRLVDDFQQPGAQPVSSIPAYQPVDEEKLAARIRKECLLEFENLRYQEERKQFERDKKQFEADKRSAIGLLVQHLSPVLSALGSKRVAGVDANEPVTASPIQQIAVEEPVEVINEIFTDKESDELFELMARFKAVEPEYMKLIERVVTMAEKGDNMYGMAKSFLLG